MSEIKTICIVTNSYNEKGNIVEFHKRVVNYFAQNYRYKYKILIIDNHSTDGTIQEIEEICKNDRNVQAIINSRNFGHIRSPFYAIQNASGDAIFVIPSDLQVAPEIIADFIPKWENGAEIVIGVKRKTQEIFPMNLIRKIYYNLINKLSEIPLRKDFIGIGLYDAKVLNEIKKINDPYPYFRGLVMELGFKVDEVLYDQKSRKRGITKNNFYSLYDLAILGICSHSKVPLRVATISGFIFSLISFVVGLFYLAYKIIYWEIFSLGLAPIVIGLFFFGSIQLMFLGVIGEYIGIIFTRVQNRPLVIEQKRINF